MSHDLDQHISSAQTSESSLDHLTLASGRQHRDAQMWNALECQHMYYQMLSNKLGPSCPPIDVGMPFEHVRRKSIKWAFQAQLIAIAVRHGSQIELSSAKKQRMQSLRQLQKNPPNPPTISNP